jgi:membrane protein
LGSATEARKRHYTIPSQTLFIVLNSAGDCVFTTSVAGYQYDAVILGNYLRGLIPGFTYLWQFLNFIVSFSIVTLLFAMIFKILPDAKIAWKDVWMGAAITAVLFNIGKSLLGLYLGHTSFASAYGAAGSLVIILTWVFYSAQILFLGAEFTQVYVKNYSKEIVPAEYAMRVSKSVSGELER